MVTLIPIIGEIVSKKIYFEIWDMTGINSIQKKKKFKILTAIMYMISFHTSIKIVLLFVLQ